MNKNILLITTRNIIENTGESALVNRRSKHLGEVLNSKIDLLIFNKKTRQKNISQLREIKEYQDIIIIGYGLKTIIFNIFQFRKILKRYLKEKNPEKIIVSGVIFSIFIFDLLKKYKKTKVEIIYDMHGCLEELLEYPTKSKLYSRILYMFLKQSEKKVLGISNSVFIVSNEMINYIKEEYGLNLKTYFIPCGIDSEDFNRDYFRKEWRKKLNIKEEEIVCVYSGGTSKWQMIEETIDYYEKNLKKLNMKMLILTKNISKVEKIIQNLNYDSSNYIFKSLNREDVIPALTAADFGIMLRESTLTNKVAFPNKFSEYLKAGLYLILTKNVIEQYRIAKKYNVGFFIEDDKILLLKKLDKVFDKVEQYKKCDLVIKNELDYKNILKIRKIFED
ncbi:glycosyltransferase [Cetobacterium sp.]|uniref:glycosyltransferase n=1 Tax=Cetobacterium sp. TaxID=2071632 RepID=UPI003EE727FD